MPQLVRCLLEATPAHDRGNRIPCLERKIGAAWIVTASVEENDLARGDRFKRCQHLVDPDLRSPAVAIGMGRRSQSGVGEDGRVVEPGQFGQPDGHIALCPDNQAGEDPKCARSTRPLNSRHPLGFRLPEDEFGNPAREHKSE